MIRLLALILFGTPLLSPIVWAHGEDKPGPHGGYIRMPGAFHTELLKVSDSRFQLYLLDINWKNPKTGNSKVTAHLKTTQGERQIACKPKKQLFECDLPKDLSWQDMTEISVEAVRDGVRGVRASYRFPLAYAY